MDGRRREGGRMLSVLRIQRQARALQSEVGRGRQAGRQVSYINPDNKSVRHTERTGKRAGVGG